MPKKMEVFKKSLLAVAVFSALVGCSEPPPKYTTENAMIDFKKANPIKVMDSYNKTLIVADSFALFNSGSSQFKDGAEDVLQDAVDVIEGLSPNLQIKVAAYATSVGSQQYTDELTKAQAAAVAAKLQSTQPMKSLVGELVTIAPGLIETNKLDKLGGSSQTKDEKQHKKPFNSLSPTDRLKSMINKVVSDTPNKKIKKKHS